METQDGAESSAAFFARHTYLGREGRLTKSSDVDLRSGKIIRVPLRVSDSVVFPFENLRIMEEKGYFESQCRGIDQKFVLKATEAERGVSFKCPRFFAHLTVNVAMIHRGMMLSEVIMNPSLVCSIGTLLECFSVSQPRQREASTSDHFTLSELEEEEVESILDTETASERVFFSAKGHSRFRVVSLDYVDERSCTAQVVIVGDAVPRSMVKSNLNRVLNPPPFVFKQFDALNLCKQALSLGSNLLMPRDPLQGSEIDRWNSKLPTYYYETVQFSYWLSSNLPAERDVLLDLLNTDSVVERLIKVIRELQSLQDNLFCCKYCNRPVSKKSHVFVISSDGAMGNYVNQHGIEHQLLTLMEVQGYRLEGDPEVEHSYFPGYSWTVLRCGTCAYLLGWKFIAVLDGQNPTEFFGLLRQQIRFLH